MDDGLKNKISWQDSATLLAKSGLHKHGNFWMNY